MMRRFRSADGRRARRSSMASVVTDSESRQSRSSSIIHRLALILHGLSSGIASDPTSRSQVRLLLLLLLLLLRLSQSRGATGNAPSHTAAGHPGSGAAHRCTSACVTVLARGDGMNDRLCVGTIVGFD